MTISGVPDFSSAWNLPKTPVRSSYIVCTTPRTGSNLLCFSLAKQGIGLPIEYLNLLGNGSTQEFYSEITQRDFETDVASNMPGPAMATEYIPRIMECRTTANGIFGMKVFAHHFTNLFGHTDLSQLTSLLKTPPKIIHLVRENLIELTVSFIMAKDSQRWHSEMTSDQSKETVYNFEDFFETMKDLNEVQNKWNSILSTYPQDQVLRLTYKQLSTSYTDTMKRVNHFLGVKDIEIPPPPIQRQMSDSKRMLIEQLTTDCRQNAKRVRTALKKSRYKHR